MPATRKAAKTLTRAREERSWAFVPGKEIVSGLHAWTLLGDGRHCETWLAWSIPLWTPVAIKLPRPGCLDQRTHAALSREARTVASLRHPAIQRLLDGRCDGPVPHLVFEYVEGPTLADVLDEKGRLAPADVARLGMQIASALHYLHANGVVHCDLKPANLALRDGRAVLIDFDIARQLGEGGEETKARGSAEYMAPEQTRGAPAAPSMDLFALGAVLYEAATDVIAFERPAQPGCPYRQLTGRPAPLRAVTPAVPGELEKAICTLLEPDPQRRPQTAMAALALLARALPPGAQGLWPEWTTRLMAETPTRSLSLGGLQLEPGEMRDPSAPHRFGDDAVPRESSRVGDRFGLLSRLEARGPRSPSGRDSRSPTEIPDWGQRQP
jgi:serine/threonine protein kinase